MSRFTALHHLRLPRVMHRAQRRENSALKNSAPSSSKEGGLVKRAGEGLHAQRVQPADGQDRCLGLEARGKGKNSAAQCHHRVPDTSSLILRDAFATVFVDSEH